MTCSSNCKWRVRGEELQKGWLQLRDRARGNYTSWIFPRCFWPFTLDKLQSGMHGTGSICQWASLWSSYKAVFAGVATTVGHVAADCEQNPSAFWSRSMSSTERSLCLDGNLGRLNEVVRSTQWNRNKSSRMTMFWNLTFTKENCNFNARPQIVVWERKFEYPLHHIR